MWAFLTQLPGARGIECKSLKSRPSGDSKHSAKAKALPALPFSVAGPKKAHSSKRTLVEPDMSDDVINVLVPPIAPDVAAVLLDLIVKEGLLWIVLNMYTQLYEVCKVRNYNDVS